MKQTSNVNSFNSFKIIRSIRLIVHEFRGNLQQDDTFLELEFYDDGVALFRGDKDGESLNVELLPWADPFSGALDTINRDYIETHGKWTRVDVSSSEPYKNLVDNTIDAISPILNKFGKLIGVEFLIAGISVNFIVEWDECHIIWGSK